MHDHAENGDRKQNYVRNKRAKGGADDVVCDPKPGIDQGPKAIFLSAFLADTSNEDKASQHRQNVCGRGEHQQICRCKGDGVQKNERGGEWFSFSLEKIIDDRLRRSDQTGNAAVERTG